MPYCGNLVVGASSVRGARVAVTERLSIAGFRIHEVEEAARYADSSGLAIDGLSGEVSPGTKEGWKIRMTADWLLRRPRVSGRMLEKFMGHVTFQMLGFRPLVSLFRNVYTFIRAQYDKATRLWRSCLKEIEWVRSLIWFARSNMRRKWHPEVLMHDSSLAGYGVMTRSGDMTRGGDTARPTSRTVRPGPTRSGRSTRSVTSRVRSRLDGLPDSFGR